MSAVIFICGTCFCGSLERPQKLEPAKISSHTVFPRKYFYKKGTKNLGWNCVYETELRSSLFATVLILFNKKNCLRAGKTAR